MLVDFKTLPETSKVWIYQSNRTFSKDELPILKEKVERFLNTWTAHGKTLQSGYEFPYNRFIVIGLNQEIHAATGCSIDASVHFIQELETEFRIDLMDKMNVSYKQGDYVAYKSLVDFKKMVKDKAVSENTIVFNNLVTNIAEYKAFWEVPASESWHNRFFA